MGVIEYDSNNSGGNWWLDDDDWTRLEEAGWVVHWIHAADDPTHTHSDGYKGIVGDHHHGYDSEHKLTKVVPSGDRWLGALARSAAKETDDPETAITEWEQVTGQDANAQGCGCCGRPHGFSYTDDDGKAHYMDVLITRTDRRWT